MKNKKFSKKMILNKTTITNLSENKMDSVKGGRTLTCATFDCTYAPCFTFDTNCSNFAGGATCVATCSPTVCGPFCVK